MAPSISQAMEKVTGMWSKSSLPQKILIGGLIASVIVIFLLLIFWFNKEDYSVLYSNLYPEDAAGVVEMLQKDKIPYQLKNNGSTIMVPTEQVYDLRLKIAGEGALHGQGIGFEIFDQNKLGQTDFIQHINYQRALQGELSRTINEIPEVESSRIHLVIPDKSLFIEQQKSPSASVMLKLKAGRSLNNQQVQSIVNLVTTAVEGLDKDHVTVTDTKGRLLYEPEDDQDFSGMSTSQLNFQNGMQKELEKRIEQLLAPIIGPGRIIAKVNADLDFNRRTVRKEIYDPNSAVVRSEQTSEETSKGSANISQNVAEQAYNGEVENAGTGSIQQVSRSASTTNFEINKEEQEIVASLGEIRKLSVAVIVDGTHEKGKNGEDVFTPLSAKELARVQQLVARAVGLDASRGDSIEVSSISFGAPETMPVPSLFDQVAKYYNLIGKPLINTILILLFLLLVVRPVVMAVIKPKVTEEESEGMEGLPEGEGQMALTDGLSEEEMHAMDSQKRIEDIKATAAQLMDQHFEQSLLVIKNWMKEGEA